MNQGHEFTARRGSTGAVLRIAQDRVKNYFREPECHQEKENRGVDCVIVTDSNVIMKRSTAGPPWRRLPKKRDCPAQHSSRHHALRKCISTAPARARRRARERTKASKHACGGAGGLPDQDRQVWVVFLDDRILGDDELASIVSVSRGKGALVDIPGARRGLGCLAAQDTDLAEGWGECLCKRGHGGDEWL